MSPSIQLLLGSVLALVVLIVVDVLRMVLKRQKRRSEGDGLGQKAEGEKT